MRSILNKVVLVFAAAFACSTLHAQSPSVVYGRTTLQLNSNFVNSFQGQGAVLTDLDFHPFLNNSVTFPAKGGAVDMGSAKGEVYHSGGILAVAGGNTIRIQDLVLDTSNPGAPLFTALVVVNTLVQGRMPLFNVQPPPGFSLPLPLQADILQENGLGLFLTSAMASEINNVFGGQVVQAGTYIGTANAYLLFSPTN